MDRIHHFLDGKPEDSLALTDFDGTDYTYGQLRDMVGQLAHALERYGIRGGDRIILVAENSVYYAVAIFAASRLDAWITLVNDQP